MDDFRYCQAYLLFFNICGLRSLYLSFKSFLTWREFALNIRVSVLTLTVLALIASCGQEKHEATLLDSMPAGYDVYATFSLSEINPGEILTKLEDVFSEAQQQMPFPIAEVLGFDPFDWDAWIETLALDPEGEAGLVVALADDEPELISFFLPSTDAGKVRDFIDNLISQAPDVEAITLITESEGYVVVALAPEQSILDEFEASLGTLTGNDDSFARLREYSVTETPSMEVFVGAAALGNSGVENMLVTCYTVESILSLQFIASIHDVEELEYAAFVSPESSGNSMNIPADATVAMHVSISMDDLKEMVIPNLPQEAQMSAGMLGFGSLEELLDIFSGDAWFALHTDGNSYSGLVAYGLSDTEGARNLIDKLTSMMGMYGEEYNSYQFQGNTCFSVDFGGNAGIETIEIGIVDDAFVVAGGYTLQEVADGNTFDDYLERTGLGIKDESGFALAADFGAVAEAYDLNEETGGLIDLEDFGFVSMSGSFDEDVYQFNFSMDFGTGNPFEILTEVISMRAFPRFSGTSAVPSPDDLTPVDKVETEEYKPTPSAQEEPVPEESTDEQVEIESVDQG
jgi:hypothetical protein